MHGTSPPEPSQQPAGRRDGPLAMLPFPVNAELVVYLAAVFLILVIVLIRDDIGAGRFVDGLQWLTIGYLLSRGIAKASRVFEV